MGFDVTTNAVEVASDLDGRIVDAAVATANQQAADRAFALVDPRTPRRSGRLAAGLRTVSAADTWALVNTVPYASVVDARTGFASKTLRDNTEQILEVYDTQLQTALDNT